MDGREGRLTDSLRYRLSLWLSLAILVVALAAGAFSFGAAYNEAHELQDDVLRQVARLFDSQHLPLARTGDAGRLANSDEDSRVIVQYLSGQPRAGESAAATETTGDRGDAPLALPSDLPDGLQTVTVKNEQFRLLAKTLASGQRIAVAQETGFRNETARDSAIRTVIPILILVPVLLLVTADLVRRMFAPIAALAAEIDRRGEQDLHPFVANSLPTEVRPFVVSINRLLGRVGESMNAQKRFVAAAAHELRSPMTALSLQAERLADAPMSDTARERLSTLRKGVERGRALLDQLLDFARAQSPAQTVMKPVSVKHVFRIVLEDLMPLAEAKNIDLGVQADDTQGERDPTVPVDEADLLVLVRNLVDNAVRYTPNGSRVDLAVHADSRRTIIQVTDNGPGISPEEHGRIFDAFYRGPGHDETGSGLGLSIVKTIADRAGALVVLEPGDSPAKTGLSVKIIFPERS